MTEGMLIVSGVVLWASGFFAGAGWALFGVARDLRKMREGT